MFELEADLNTAGFLTRATVGARTTPLSAANLDGRPVRERFALERGPRWMAAPTAGPPPTLTAREAGARSTTTC
jgi:hypothetical protein